MGVPRPAAVQSFCLKKFLVFKILMLDWRESTTVCVRNFTSFYECFCVHLKRCELPFLTAKHPLYRTWQKQGIEKFMISRIFCAWKRLKMYNLFAKSNSYMDIDYIFLYCKNSVLHYRLFLPCTVIFQVFTTLFTVDEILLL